MTVSFFRLRLLEEGLRSRRRLERDVANHPKTIVGISASGIVSKSGGGARVLNFAKPRASAQHATRFVGEAGVGLLRICARSGRIGCVPILTPFVDIAANEKAPGIGFKRIHRVGGILSARLKPRDFACFGWLVAIVPCRGGAGAASIFPLRLGRQAEGAASLPGKPIAELECIGVGDRRDRLVADLVEPCVSPIESAVMFQLRPVPTKSSAGAGLGLSAVLRLADEPVELRESYRKLSDIIVLRNGDRVLGFIAVSSWLVCWRPHLKRAVPNQDQLQ